MNIFNTLKKLKDQERKQPMRIYQDEQTGQIIEEPLTMDMAASALIHETMKQYNQAKLIHMSIFGN
jgi:hypothetical protein